MAGVTTQSGEVRVSEVTDSRALPFIGPEPHTRPSNSEFKFCMFAFFCIYLEFPVFSLRIFNDFVYWYAFALLHPITLFTPWASILIRPG